VWRYGELFLALFDLDEIVLVFIEEGVVLPLEGLVLRFVVYLL
jgi:hypothetical protein